MSRAVRAVVLMLAVAVFVVAVGATMRELLLAADAQLVWRLPSWWQELPRQEGWRSAAVGAAALALALLCIAVLTRVFARPRPPAALGVGSEGGSVDLRREALERVLAAAIAKAVPELRATRVLVQPAAGGLAVTVAGVASPVDLPGLHARTLAAVADEAQTATGRAVVRLDLMVERFSDEAEGV